MSAPAIATKSPVFEPVRGSSPDAWLLPPVGMRTWGVVVGDGSVLVAGGKASVVLVVLVVVGAVEGGMVGAVVSGGVIAVTGGSVEGGKVEGGGAVVDVVVLVVVVLDVVVLVVVVLDVEVVVVGAGGITEKVSGVAPHG